MLSNINFKAIEDLKMTRAEEYDYDKFLSDSSDDYPKYDEGIEVTEPKENCHTIKPSDDAWIHTEIYSNKNATGINIALAKSDGKIDLNVSDALNHVLSLALERADQIPSWKGSEGIKSKAIESIEIVKKLL